jgi:hypothetical protein
MEESKREELVEKKEKDTFVEALNKLEAGVFNEIKN